LGDWGGRWVVKATTQVEGVVVVKVVEGLDRAATQVKDVEVVRPVVEGGSRKLSYVRGNVVVKRTTETEGVVVVDVVGTVVVVGWGSF